MSAQLSIDFDALDFEFSPAQATWLGRERGLRDPRRSRTCEGCHHFGLCLLHSQVTEPSAPTGGT